MSVNAQVEVLKDELAEAREQLDTAEAEIEELQDALDGSTTSLHSLHEQAHGPVPWTTCQLVPCRHLYDRVHGPAR